MKDFIGAHEVLSTADLIELALGLDDPDVSAPLAGIDMDLFRGPLSGESEPERAARLAAAGDVLADLFEQGASDEIAELDAAYAAALMHTTPLRSRTGARRRVGRGVAA
jgi:hypothetical protein